MTVWFFIHSITKRAEALALVDSGATKNFMNLSYAWWLKLPIKLLEKPCKLFNVNGTENKSGELKYYTNLSVQTGTTWIPLQFFLTDLGKHKAILGYPWFATVQPKINWKQGWIDHTQLPIVLQSPDAQKAVFRHRNQNFPRPILSDRYFIGKVMIGTSRNDKDPDLPTEYQRHSKIFSENELQRLLGHTIWDHAIELLPGCKAAVIMLPYSIQSQVQLEIHEWHTPVCRTTDCTWQ